VRREDPEASSRLYTRVFGEASSKWFSEKEDFSSFAELASPHARELASGSSFAIHGKTLLFLVLFVFLFFFVLKAIQQQILAIAPFVQEAIEVAPGQARALGV
jgi:hypothetical protein